MLQMLERARRSFRETCVRLVVPVEARVRRFLDRAWEEDGEIAQVLWIGAALILIALLVIFGKRIITAITDWFDKNDPNKTNP